MILHNRRPAARRRRNAFTLLEVLVVVAILVVLASVASFYILRYLEDAKIDKAKLDVDTLGKALMAYTLRNDSTPPDSLAQLITPPDGGRPFIEGGQTALIDPWGQQYQYNPGGVGSGGEAKPEVFTVAPNGTRVSNLK